MRACLCVCVSACLYACLCVCVSVFRLKGRDGEKDWVCVQQRCKEYRIHYSTKTSFVLAFRHDLYLSLI